MSKNLYLNSILEKTVKHIEIRVNLVGLKNIYYQNNKEKVKKRRSDYNKTHKKEYNEKRRIRYNENKRFRIRQILSKRIHDAIKKLKDNEITLKYLNCDIDYFINWLEFQFYDGMTWSNYGTFWHIDHTLPVSSFNFDNDEEIKRCFNWINMRPLRADKNLLKSNKVNMMEYIFQEIKAFKFRQIHLI